MVAPDEVIGIELDLHCHLGEQVINTADIVVTYKEYLHVNVNDRATEVCNLAIKTRKSEAQPTMVLFDCNMIGMYSTFTPTIRSFIEKVTETE